MAWKIKEIWRNHTYAKGAHKGETHRAFPQCSDARGGYDTYPAGAESSNLLDDAEVARSLAELYEHLGRGRGVRCNIPTTGDTPILSGRFLSSFEQT